MRKPEPLQLIGRTEVLWHGRRLVYFSGCDYFRLASHPRVLHALQRGLLRYGLSVSASRMTTGQHTLYIQLEQALSSFFEAPAALLVSDGYNANLAVAQALAGHVTHVLLDDHAHPSLQDAALFLKCPTLRFPHASPQALAGLLKPLFPAARPVLLTDGLFSLDGSVAPLKEYLRLLPREAVLVVDDAHGAGVVGQTGKGSLEYCGERPGGRIIQTLSLSKAIGGFGGAVLGSQAVCAQILTRSRLFAGSTPFPLPLAAAALESLRLLRGAKGGRRRLWRNAALLKETARKAGFPGWETPGPILCVTPSRPRQARQLKEALLEAGIFPPFLRYPGGPPSGAFRFVLSSEHSAQQVRLLGSVLSGSRP